MTALEAWRNPASCGRGGQRTQSGLARKAPLSIRNTMASLGRPDSYRVT